MFSLFRSERRYSSGEPLSFMPRGTAFAARREAGECSVVGQGVAKGMDAEADGDALEAEREYEAE